MISNTRRQELMKLLESSRKDAPLTVETIARHLQVSERAVRYDLDAVEDELKGKGLALCRKTQKGIWVEPLTRDAAEDAVSGGGMYTYVPNKAERCQTMLVRLIDAAEPVVAERLAEEIGISRSTLLADLKSVELALQGRGLRLASKRGLGMWAEGTEEAARDALVQIFSGCLHDFGRDALRDTVYESALFRSFTEGLPVKETADFFIALVNARRLPGYDSSINFVLVALLVQLKRLCAGHVIREGRAPSGSMFGLMAERIAAQLAPYAPEIQSDTEKAYLEKQLLSSKIYLLADDIGPEESDAINLMALNLARTFIEYSQVWLGDVYLDDEELLYNLALHLQPAVKRAKYGIELINPLLPQIRREYGNLFMIAWKAAKRIEEQLDIKISEDEIGYLALHLGGAVERKKFRRAKHLQVLLVCGNGLGTANLLAMTLKNRFNCLNIKKIVSVYELDAEILQGIDIVVSTMPLKLEGIAVLHISPILSGAEIKVIETQIQYLYGQKFAATGKFPLRVEEKPRLCALLRAETIRLGVAAASWQDAVRAAGALLVAAGGVEMRYVDSMITCVERMGPYIVVGPGIALPHARADDGVLRVAMSFVRLAEPIRFGSEENDPVRFVFAFGAVDERSHLRALYELWQIFYDKKAMAALERAQSPAEAAEILAAYPFTEEESLLGN